MKVYIGDETGLVKRLHFTKKKLDKTSWRTQDGNRQTCLFWPNSDDYHTLGHVTRGRRVDLTQTGTGTLLGSFTPELEENDSIVFTCGLNRGTEILTCTEQGQVHISRTSSDFQFSEPTQVLCTRAPVHGCDLHASSRRLALGGKDNDLQVWDLTENKLMWSAKNVSHVNRLKVPIAIRQASFTPDSPSIVLTGTGHNQVRLYDIRVKRKPMMDVRVEKKEEHGDFTRRNPLTSLAVSRDGRFVVTGETTGEVSQLDIRQNLQKTGMYQGAHGSIRGLAIHPDNSLLAAVGLDRHLRIYNLSTRSPVAKVYVKQKTNTVLFDDTVYNPEQDNEAVHESPGSEKSNRLAQRSQPLSKGVDVNEEGSNGSSDSSSSSSAPAGHDRVSGDSNGSPDWADSPPPAQTKRKPSTGAKQGGHRATKKRR